MIIFKTGTFYTRSILALISIMDKEEKYTTAEMRKQSPAGPKADIMGVETQKEREAARLIVKKLKKGLHIVNATQQLEQGLWWDRGETCNLKEVFAD